MKTNIKGVGVALITPFNDNGDVDFEALERLLDRVAAGGADYLVVLGTTAETPTLSAAEKEAVTKFIVSKNGGRMPVVIGIGGNCTAEYPPFRFYRYRCRFIRCTILQQAFAGGNLPALQGNCRGVAPSGGHVQYPGPHRREHDCRDDVAPGPRMQKYHCRKRGIG